MTDAANNLTAEHMMLSVFTPEYFKRAARLVGGGRLVHYTSAEAAMSVINAQSVWMRNVTLMNDFLEIDYGIEFAHRALSSEPGKRFIERLREIESHGVQSALNMFDNWVNNARYSTYIISLSDHDDAEDAHGRLSMWRAYGGTASVALVLNSAPFVTPTDALGAFSTSVEYLDWDAWAGPMTTRLLTLEANLAPVTQQKEWIYHYLSQMLLGTALGVKHPGFGEEREWRVYHMPTMYPENPPLKHQIVGHKGVPQRVYLLPLAEPDPATPIGIATPALLNRVIIGPSEYPGVLRDAFVELLTTRGVSNAAERVVCSGIPIR